MNKLAQFTAIAALGIGGHAMAAGFDYHYFDGGLVLADGPGNDGKGVSVTGSMDEPQLFRNATVFGGARYLDFDYGNLLNLEAGIGFHAPISGIVDFTSGGALELDRFTHLGSDLGFNLNAGVRARPFGPQWELDGGLKYADVGHYYDGDHVHAVLGGRYTFSPNVSVGLQLDSGDVDYWTLSLRWEL
ncbi:MAG: hypothetical protein WDO12_07590 [Pseudomonadota bacterium]